MEKANFDHRPNLTELEKKHVDFMAEIARSVSDSPTVLKGGTALLLSYGLNRYSEDLDFDSTKPLNLEKRINDSAKKQNIDIELINLKKDTPTTKRYIVFYESEEGAGRLKIETSFRDSEIPKEDTTVINGIKTYPVEDLISQKLGALDGRSKVRDIHDVNYLAEKYGSSFKASQIEKLGELTKEPDQLVSRFKADHLADHILKKQSLDDLVLNLQANVEAIKIIKERSLKMADKKEEKDDLYYGKLQASKEMAPEDFDEKKWADIQGEFIGEKEAENKAFISERYGEEMVQGMENKMNDKGLNEEQKSAVWSEIKLQAALREKTNEGNEKPEIKGMDTER